MSLRDDIIQAAPRYETADFEIYGKTFRLNVLLVPMADFNARLKRISSGDSAALALEMSDWFREADTDVKAFAPEDFDRMPAKTVKALMELFSRVNTGTGAEKNA